MEFPQTIFQTPKSFSTLLSNPKTPITLHASFSPQIPKSQRSISREESIPTMAEILEASKRQNLDIRLQTLGPVFRISAKNLETQREVGKAEGIIRVWIKGKILHLDSIRLNRESLSMKKSIFGIGLFVGAVAVRYGFDCGCETVELLAINDSEVFHSKLVRFYRRMGFKVVEEVSGSKMRDFGHMLVWGGVGTRMDAQIQPLLIKWSPKFKQIPPLI